MTTSISPGRMGPSFKPEPGNKKRKRREDEKPEGVKRKAFEEKNQEITTQIPKKISINAPASSEKVVDVAIGKRVSNEAGDELLPQQLEVAQVQENKKQRMRLRQNEFLAMMNRRGEISQEQFENELRQLLERFSQDFEKEVLDDLARGKIPLIEKEKFNGLEKQYPEYAALFATLEQALPDIKVDLERKLLGISNRALLQCEINNLERHIASKQTVGEEFSINLIINYLAKEQRVDFSEFLDPETILPSGRPSQLREISSAIRRQSMEEIFKQLSTPSLISQVDRKKLELFFEKNRISLRDYAEPIHDALKDFIAGEGIQEQSSKFKEFLDSKEFKELCNLDYAKNFLKTIDEGTVINDIVADLDITEFLSADARRKLQTAQIDALKEMMKQSENQQITSEKIRESEWEAKFKTLGANDYEIAIWLPLLQYIRSHWDVLMNTFRTSLELHRIIKELPPFAKESCIIPKFLCDFQNTLKQDIDHACDEGLVISIKKFLSDLSMIEQEIERASQVDYPRMEFYKKWSGFLLKEVIQGFLDKGDNLGGGICWGLCQRWVIQEMKKEPLQTIDDFLKEQKMGEILPEDRLLQVRSELAAGTLSFKETRKVEARTPFKIDKLSIEDDKVVTETDEAIEEYTDWDTLGIESELKQQFYSIKIEISKDLEKLLGALLENPYVQSAPNGVVGLTFHFDMGTSHAIYFRYQPDTKTFRIGDPNYGIFQVDTKEQFLECLNDFITCLYPDCSTILTNHYSVKSSSKTRV